MVIKQQVDFFFFFFPEFGEKHASFFLTLVFNL